MLFRVTNSDGKFIQYISLCMSDEGMQNGALNKSTIRALHKSNIPQAKNITELNINYYVWLNSPITIQCYDAFNASIYLTEILSDKRDKAIKARQSLWNNALMYKATSSSTSNSIYVSDGYIGNTLSTTVTLSSPMQYIYTTFSTRNAI